MKKVVIGILAVLGLFAILAVLGIGFLGFISMTGKPRVPSETLLEINFERGTIEAIPSDPLAEMMLKGSLTVREVVDALDRAAGDRRGRPAVRGARTGHQGAEPGRVFLRGLQELQG